MHPNVFARIVTFAKIQILCGMQASSGSSNTHKHKPLVKLKSKSPTWHVNNVAHQVWSGDVYSSLVA